MVSVNDGCEFKKKQELALKYFCKYADRKIAGDANIPLPSEARIVEMAQAKGLDPQTGRPLKAGR
ncbi:hypothetical protein SAMN05660284_00683 [Formivibrio citricus]|uniref:DUF6396 domain-containing protein n=1 Tax=Formivibrio citricus TaxID=83765 RepID=A0A1I4WSL4_9NEIS|nr:hypothetical protein SAMN05660284_00683 [Formivibrio citricus]